jgi:hypothetical protein
MGRCDSEMTGVWSCPDQVCPDTVLCPSFNAVVSHHASSRGQRQLACAISNRSALGSLAMRRGRFP